MAAVLRMHIVQQPADHSYIRTTRRYYLSVHSGFFEDARKAVEVVMRT